MGKVDVSGEGSGSLAEAERGRMVSRDSIGGERSGSEGGGGGYEEGGAGARPRVLRGAARPGPWGAGSLKGR